MEQLVSYWTAFENLQETFKAAPLKQFLGDHDEIPVFAVTAYLCVVFYGAEFMKERKAMKLHHLFSFWNLLLAIFSILGFIATAPTFVSALVNKGFQFTVCASPSKWYVDGATGFWVAAFILSKIPELFDTVFLVTQKKTVIFLHWYHHTTVMLYCWHAYQAQIGAGLWFATMNYCVHSIMYSYYFFMNVSGFTRSLVKPVAPLITTLQLVQMVLGMTVAVAARVYHQTIGCESHHEANNKMGLFMYTTYFILFGFLFKKLYCSPKPSSGKTKKDDDVCTATMNTQKAFREGERAKAE